MGLLLLNALRQDVDLTAGCTEALSWQLEDSIAT